MNCPKCNNTVYIALNVTGKPIKYTCHSTSCTNYGKIFIIK